jgi:UDP-3-O-[3-hydroxymyristoyl] glucosamine N-acyltransferase
MLTAANIVKQIGLSANIIGDENLEINKVRTLEEADADSLIWVAKNKPGREAIINGGTARVIVCDSAIDISQIDTNFKTLILTSDPRLYFLYIVRKFFTPQSPKEVHRTVS